MSRAYRKSIAAETVQLSANYPPSKTTLYKLEQLSTFAPTSTNKQTAFEVSQFDVVETVHYMCEYVPKELSKIGVLNFASAKNPGGGFLNGSVAQEEAICYASTLYRDINNSAMHASNRRDPQRGLYQNMGLYTTGVSFFRDQNYDILKTPSIADVVTIPAVNATHAKENGVDHDTINKTMKLRIDSCLQLFADHGCDGLVLGAFGCGVFGNDPRGVAKTFYQLLTTKYRGVFGYVTFAVLGDREFKIFQNAFKNLL